MPARKSFLTLLSGLLCTSLLLLEPSISYAGQKKAKVSDRNPASIKLIKKARSAKKTARVKKRAYKIPQKLKGQRAILVSSGKRMAPKIPTRIVSKPLETGAHDPFPKPVMSDLNRDIASE